MKILVAPRDIVLYDPDKADGPLEFVMPFVSLEGEPIRFYNYTSSLTEITISCEQTHLIEDDMGEYVLSIKLSGRRCRRVYVLSNGVWILESKLR